MHDVAPPNDRSADTWWSRPAGGREVFQVALPLVVSSLSWTVMTFVDRVLLKAVSGAAMSAAFSSGVVWFVALCLPLGVCMYSATFVSQYHGAGQPRRIGPATWQGVWAALAATPIVLAMIPLAPAIFAAANHSPAIQANEVIYFQALSWGAPAMLIAQALSSFYSGRGRTSVVMAVDATFAGVNLVLDYFWIFGYAGFPEMGIAGAAWATVTAMWLKAATYLLLMMQRQHRERFATLSGMIFDRALFVRLMYFGGPSGVQLLLDVMGFTVFILLLGRLGPVPTEASAMAFSISSLAFMPVYGISMATTILVGQHLGEDRDHLASRATWTTLHLGWAYMGLVSLLYVFTPGLFLGPFFAGETPIANHDAVYALAVVLLRFVAAYNLMDATMMIFVGALKGAGDTRYIMGVSLVAASLLAGLSWLAVMRLGLGVYGCWTLITLWVFAMGAAFLLRFLQGSWRAMRVIEKAPPDLAAEPLVEATTA